ncbi:hypothetical protein N7520_010565 [Penicillium odoratum]|uniref:uncharacterized protein n=1 Tax=Penicillium odoratum TaxID=1167516 RepID=UPI00254910F7|nr:uncharacterized protein N7520_010565 [Penicillium odoratum]KAJ5745383.1 hypothetical protein N7520_010565 [Penicillium odoratum]
MATSRINLLALRSRTGIVCAFAVLGAGAYFGTSLLAPTGHAESNGPYTVFKRGLGFTTLRLKHSEAVNHNTKRLVFEFPDENARSGLSLTSALLTISRPNNRWIPIIRPYTPISSLDKPGSIEFLIKHYPNGKASTHMHSLKPGDTLTFAATLKGFNWVPNQFSQVHLIAGGAGITPIYQLLQGILNNPEDKTNVNLVFGVNTERDLLLKKELEQYKERFPGRFNYSFAVSSLTDEKPSIRKGYVNEELLRDVVGKSDKDTMVFVCGPPAMEDSLVGSRSTPGVLGRLGFTSSQIYKF